jgi:hypothetical protein
LPATAHVTGAGANAGTFPALLTTTPQGDDIVNAAGNAILAGQNGIADTEANHDQGANFPLKLNRAWRNPERNEIFIVVPRSRHQYGAAVDLKIVTVPTGYTKANAYCVLESVGNLYFEDGLAEGGSTPKPCASSEADNVHIE